MTHKRLYWDNLLNEVLNKKQQVREDNFYSTKTNASTGKSTIQKKAKPIRYYLGDDYKDIAFTKREAECMIYFIKGKTIAGVAAILNLSPRTIEFYANNMKKKLKCKTKSELIGKVLSTKFINNIDFKY